MANYPELFKMVCEKNETDINVGIPVVMLPQDAGESLKENMRNSSHGKASPSMVLVIK